MAKQDRTGAPRKGDERTDQRIIVLVDRATKRELKKRAQDDARSLSSYCFMELKKVVAGA